MLLSQTNKTYIRWKYTPSSQRIHLWCISFYANSIQNKSLNSCTQSFYGYNLIRSYISRKNLNKDHFVLMLELIKLYRIKREELYFMIPFVM